MPLPAGVGTCTVTGLYLDAEGTPVAGSVVFYLAQPLIDASDHVIVTPGPYTATLTSGAFSLALPYSDNTAVQPTGFSYQVFEQVPGGRSYYIQLPRALGATVDLAALVPSPSPSQPLWGVQFGQLSTANTWTALNDFTGGLQVAGTTIVSPPGGTTEFLRGDGTWQAPPSGAVTSVNSHTGAVVLTSTDVGAIPTSAEGAASGVATLDSGSHLTAAQVPFGSAGTSAVGDAAAPGTASTVSHSDHVHGREAFAAPASATGYGLTAVTGTAATLAHSDHAHGTPALTTTAPATTLAIGTAAALGSAVLPALADHVHPMAAAATPTTSAVGDTATIGNAATFATSNHVHGREGFGTVSALSAFGTSSANGSATTTSHSDHQHGAPSLPTATTSTAGIIQLDGTAGDIAALGAQNAGSVGKAADAGHIHPTTGLILTSAAATTVQSGTSYGTASTVGTDLTFAREDHQHGTVALTSTAPATTEGIGQAAAVGTATTPARADHVHPLAASATAGASAVADTASAGSATTFAASDHRHSREAFGAVTANTVWGGTSADGTASTVSHSDHIHGLPDAYTYDSPSQRGLVEWNFPVTGAYLGTQTLISGTIYGVSFVAQTNKTVSNLCVSVQTQAVTPTTGQNLMALYSVSGTTWTQIGITGDLGVWGSGQFNAFPMGGSVTLVRGAPYAVLILSVAGTAVKLNGNQSPTQTWFNTGCNATSAPWRRIFTGGTTQTALPSPSFTASGSTMSTTATLNPWVALS